MTVFLKVEKEKIVRNSILELMREAPKKNVGIFFLIGKIS